MRSDTAPHLSTPASVLDYHQFGLLQRPWLQNLTSSELLQVARRTRHSLLHLQNSLATESHRQALLLAEKTQHTDSSLLICDNTLSYFIFPHTLGHPKNCEPETLWGPLASFYAKAREWTTPWSTRQPVALHAISSSVSQRPKTILHRLPKLNVHSPRQRDTFKPNESLLSYPPPLPHSPTPATPRIMPQETLKPLTLSETQSPRPLSNTLPCPSPQALILEATIELDKKHTPGLSTSVHLLRVAATESIEEAVEAFVGRLCSESNLTEDHGIIPPSAQAALIRYLETLEEEATRLPVYVPHPIKISDLPSLQRNSR